MKKNLFYFAVILFSTVSFTNLKAEDSFGRQMFRNFNIGWDVNRTNNYRWSDFHIGTAYGKHFSALPKAGWQIGIDYNWNKYTIYGDGAYALSMNNDILRTRSLSFPFTVSYDIFESFFQGMKVYTGPKYEMILSSTLNGGSYSGLNTGQWGWTIGTRIRFLAIFSARLAYNYYPTALFRNGNMDRSAINLSIGF